METPCAVTDMKYCPGVPTFAPSGLRTHICQVPRRQAKRNATNATQKCARQSRSTLRTGNPPVWSRLELILAHHLHGRPHLAVAETAILMARHQKAFAASEFRVHLRDEARNHHELGGDGAHGDPSVRTYRRSQIMLGELTRQVQRLGIDALDVAGWID